MFFIEWRLTLISLVLLPILYFPALRVGEKLRQITKENNNLSADSSTLVDETTNVDGALLMKILGREKDIYTKYRFVYSVASWGMQRAQGPERIDGPRH